MRDLEGETGHDTRHSLITRLSLPSCISSPQDTCDEGRSSPFNSHKAMFFSCCVCSFCSEPTSVRTVCWKCWTSYRRSRVSLVVLSFPSFLLLSSTLLSFPYSLLTTILHQEDYFGCLCPLFISPVFSFFSKFSLQETTSSLCSDVDSLLWYLLHPSLISSSSPLIHVVLFLSSRPLIFLSATQNIFLLFALFSVKVKREEITLFFTRTKRWRRWRQSLYPDFETRKGWRERMKREREWKEERRKWDIHFEGKNWVLLWFFYFPEASRVYSNKTLPYFVRKAEKEI